MIATGQRDKRVLLENPGGTVPDGEGGYIEGWEALNPGSVFARIAPASQTDLERAAAGTVISTATHLIEVLYHPGVTVFTRITYNGRVFQVTAVRNPDEANRELVIVAEEQL
jgi:SPP1 family predicted phage head-tail adaptor